MRSERAISPKEMRAARPNPAAREPCTKAAGCCPPPSSPTRWLNASPIAVAGSSQETTTPGSDSPPSHLHPRPETALTRAVRPAAVNSATAIRGMRLGHDGAASLHHQPMSTTPINAGIFTSPASTHKARPITTWS